MTTKVDLKYIVTGTGRCGTLFMANLLTSMGFPCSHEAIFTPKGFYWAKEVIDGLRPLENSEISKGDNLSEGATKIVAESSYMAAPFLKKIDKEVIHVVRNPFKVIASLTGNFFKLFTKEYPVSFESDPLHFQYEDFIYKNMPEIANEETQLDRGCLYYIRWNEMIENSGKTTIFHRIEDGNEKIKKFFGFKGAHYDNSKCNSTESFSTNWTISQIKNQKIKHQMIDIIKRYKYSAKIKIF